MDPDQVVLHLADPARAVVVHDTPELLDRRVAVLPGEVTRVVDDHDVIADRVLPDMRELLRDRGVERAASRHAAGIVAVELE